MRIRAIFFISFVYLSLVWQHLCVEKVYRAYIPKESIEWFNWFLKEKSELVDIWLSTRITENWNKTLTSSSSSAVEYKYYTEFKVSNSSIIESNRAMFNKHRIKLETLIDDVHKHLESLKAVNRNRRSSEYSFNKVVGKYVQASHIISWMMEIAKNHPDLVQVYRIGKTFENRPIMVLKLTNQPSKKIDKQLFMYDGGIHAREWISVAAIVYLIDKLIKDFKDSNEIVTKLLNKYELHFIPILNPDGYEFSRASKFNRYWRKNMRYTKFNTTDNTCYGVDLNRNFDYKWMVSGASANPCSEVYAGRYPGSEPEIKSVMKYILGKKSKWLSHISLHSYGAVWLSPFSYSRHHMQDNFEETCQKALIAINKIKKVHKYKYRFGCASFELYEAGGCSEDWSREIAKINHSYVIELKPNISESPESGFEHPESEIVKTSQEIYDGLLEYMNSFITNQVDDKIVQECKIKKEMLLEELKEQPDSPNDYDYIQS